MMEEAMVRKSCSLICKWSVPAGKAVFRLKDRFDDQKGFEKRLYGIFGVIVICCKTHDFDVVVVKLLCLFNRIQPETINLKSSIQLYNILTRNFSNLNLQTTRIFQLNDEIQFKQFSISSQSCLKIASYLSVSARNVPLSYLEKAHCGCKTQRAKKDVY